MIWSKVQKQKLYWERGARRRTYVDSMRIVLKSIGFSDVYSAANGQQALNQVIHEANVGEPFDLVISDINMPILNGLAFLEKLKNNPHISDTHVFMVSTRSELEIVLRAIEVGASNYLIKSFDKEKIRQKIMQIFYPTED